jgi:predicted aspartyl protease
MDFKMRKPTLVLAIFLWSCYLGQSAEAQSRVTMEQMLGHLRYGGVALIKDKKPSLRVEGSLSNGKKCIFLVDTGWTYTTLDPSAAKGFKKIGELGITLEDTLLGTITNSEVVPIPRLKLGAAEFSNQPARIKKLEMDFRHIPQSGVLGLDFLVRNFCIVDVGARHLYFRAAAPSEEEKRALQASLRNSGFTDVHISLRPMLNVGVSINDKLIKMGLDTGAEYTTLDEGFARKLNLRSENLNLLAIGNGSIGHHRARVALVSKLQIGEQMVRNYPLSVVDLKYWEQGEHNTFGDDILGLLGYDVLASRGALIDLRGQRLWLLREQQK